MKTAALEKVIHHIFTDKSLLQTALCHRSYVNEHPDEKQQDNETLEFLGDAVLSLTTGHLLMELFPDQREGDLSRMRAGIVNETSLAELARAIDLGAYIRLGKGEAQSQGHEKNSILADAYEALIAAIYLDQGFDAVFSIVRRHFTPLLQPAVQPVCTLDYKSRLQELAQEKFKITPSYQIVDESGPDHNKTFVAQVRIREILSRGAGKSKKMAEQEAARNALQQIDTPNADAS